MRPVVPRGLLRAEGPVHEDAQGVEVARSLLPQVLGHTARRGVDSQKVFHFVFRREEEGGRLSSARTFDRMKAEKEGIVVKPDR